METLQVRCFQFDFNLKIYAYHNFDFFKPNCMESEGGFWRRGKTLIIDLVEVARLQAETPENYKSYAKFYALEFYHS